MTLKEDKTKKDAYFNIPKNDREDFDLEEEEKAEKDGAAKKVFDKLNEKYKK